MFGLYEFKRYKFKLLIRFFWCNRIWGGGHNFMGRGKRSKLCSTCRTLVTPHWGVPRGGGKE